METKNCQNCKQDFTIEPEDFDFYNKIKVPPPTFCPECRLIRKLMWRNERTLYTRQCSLCKKDIISIYHDQHGFPVYCHDCWNNDTWDGLTYGLNIPDGNFFTALKQLFEIAPRPDLDVVNSIDSDYTNHTQNVKNCYLTFGAIELENGYYDDQVYHSKDVFDSDLIIKCDSLYESGNCIECFQVYYSENAVSCLDSYFLYDCVGCTYCFGCVNLRNQSYCIFNVKYPKEEYFEKIQQYDVSSFEEIEKLREIFKKFKLTQLHRFAFIKNSYNCSGDNIEYSNNCKKCFDLRAGAENLKFSVLCGYNMKDSYDVYGGGIVSDLGYEAISFTGNHNVCFSKQVRQSTDVFYSEFCVNCHDVFGCVGLKNKSYCIFNKQYSQEEYNAHLENLLGNSFADPYVSALGHTYAYGEFFPIEFSYMSYDETAAQKFFPLTKEEALKKGYTWRGEKDRNYMIEIKNSEIVDSIVNADESIIGRIIECAHSGNCNHGCTQAFKILKVEFAFYKKNNIPIPHECPNCRYAKRVRDRNPLQLWTRTCMNQNSPVFNGPCQNTFETSYAPERKELIYCEDCYKREVL